MTRPKTGIARKNPAPFGSIERRGDRYRALYLKDGVKIRAPKTFATAQEARAWLAREAVAIADGTWTPRIAPAAMKKEAGRLTLASSFAELCEALIAEDEAYNEARPATLHEQARLIRRVIIPALGERKIGEIRPSMLDAAYQEWHSHSPSQARNALVALRKVIKLGKRRDLFTFDLADGIRTHARPKREIVTLEPMHLADLRGYIEAWRCRTDRRGPEPSTLLLDVVNVMLATSARIGEALGLRVQDIEHIEDGTIVHIRGTMIEGHGQAKHWQEATKTAAGVRSILVPEWVTPTLERLSATAEEGSTPYLFHTATGQIEGAHAVHRQLRAVRSWAGLSDEIVPHVFRKTVATAIADHEQGGIDSAALVLGHSRSRVTEQHYAKRRTLAPDMRAALALLGPAVGEQEGNPRVT